MLDEFLDALFGIVWLGTTWFLVHSAYTLARRPFTNEPAVSVCLHTTLFAVGSCILILTLLGGVGAISRPSCLVGAFVLGLLLRNVQPNATPCSIRPPEPRGTKYLWGAVAATIVGHSILHGLLQFPDDWDCLMYHLPLIDQWIRSGSLAATDISRWSQPGNSEILGLWFAVPFSGDFLVPLNNLPVMLIWVTGLLELGYQIGLRGWWRHLAALACIAVYTTVHQTDDASNDLMVVAFFVAGLAYAIRFQKSKSRADLTLFGVVLGLLVGTKYLALGYGALLGVVLVSLCFILRGWRDALVSAAYAVTVSIPFGAYWYVRNLVMTGYPLFPSGAPIVHEQMLYGDLKRTSLLFNGSPAVPDLAFDAIWRLCGPIQIAAVSLIPAILVGLIFTGGTFFKSRRVQHAGPWLLCVSLLGTFTISLVTPFLVEDQPGTLNHLRWAYTPVRYMLCFLSMAVLSLALLLQALGAALPRIAERGLIAAFGVIAAGQFCYRFWSRMELDMNLAAIVGFDAVLIVFGLSWLYRHRAWGKVVAVGSASLIVCLTIGMLSYRWHDGYASHFNSYFGTDLFAIVDGASPQTIVVLDDRPYPYFGSRRQNRMVQPYSFSSVEQVGQLLNDEGATLVATRFEPDKEFYGYRPSSEALAEDPDFVLVGEGYELKLFEYLNQSGRVHSGTVDE